MDNQREPLYRVVGGSGTYTDPHVMRSDLLNRIDRLYHTGRSVAADIAQAREKLALADISEETRSQLEDRITDVEYQWHRGLAAYLVQQIPPPYKLPGKSTRQRRPSEEIIQLQKERADKKRNDLIRQAHEARDAFYEFAGRHPILHERRRGEVSTIEELLANHEVRFCSTS